MYLENWLYERIRSELKADPEFRRSTGTFCFEQFARRDVIGYQLFKLRQTLQYVSTQSSVYRELFEKAGVKPEDIRRLSDMSRLPFTEPQQLSEVPYRFLCLSQSEVARPYTFVTSGTTGPKKKIFWSHGDLERITDFMAAGIGTVADQDDVVQIILPDGRPNSQADLLHKGVIKYGATPVMAAFDLDAEEQLKIIEDHHSTVLFGYTGQIFRLSKELEAKCDLNKKGVKVLFLAAEYLPDSRRRELEKIWNSKIYTHYGLTEMGLGVAVECEAGDGYHFNEADLLLEVINPQTGEPVRAGDEGELVFTTLNREAMPLIRYRTHDLSRLIDEPCACGAVSLLKFDKVKKRLEAIVRIGDGDEMYPSLFDDTLFDFRGLIDYQVVLTREGKKDRLDFKIEMICPSAESSREIAEKLLTEPIIERNIAAGRMALPKVELVGSGALRASGREKKLIVDRR
jgi:phenylacetate-CoA ligase